MATATYTFHVPPGADPADPDSTDRALVVCDAFSWGAFLAPMLWFFSHRHWLAGLAALVVVALLGIVLWLAGFGAGTIVAAELLLHLLFGFEGASLRRWLLARQGRPTADIVQAGSHEEAEVKSFARWLAGEAHSVSDGVRPLAHQPSRYDPEPVIGLFPDPDGRRA